MGFARSRARAAERSDRRLVGVEAENREMRIDPVVAVARDDDVARDIDIVDQPAFGKGQVLAGEVIDVQPRLLVGRDDQGAAREIGRASCRERVWPYV